MNVYHLPNCGWSLTLIIWFPQSSTILNHLITSTIPVFHHLPLSLQGIAREARFRTPRTQSATSREKINGLGSTNPLESRRQDAGGHAPPWESATVVISSISEPQVVQNHRAGADELVEPRISPWETHLEVRRINNFHRQTIYEGWIFVHFQVGLPEGTCFDQFGVASIRLQLVSKGQW